MLRGIANVSFYAADLEAASAWYTDVLGLAPYFVTPGYIEFRLGDSADELGIIDATYAPHPVGPAAGGEVVYWHVDDVAGSLATLLEKGATEHGPVTERGAGFVTASVRDPFGNVLGIMANPHYLEVLAGGRSVAGQDQ